MKSLKQFKLGILQALTSINYESSRTPLFLILNSFNLLLKHNTNFDFQIFFLIYFFLLLIFIA